LKRSHSYPITIHRRRPIAYASHENEKTQRREEGEKRSKEGSKEKQKRVWGWEKRWFFPSQERTAGKARTRNERDEGAKKARKN